MQILNTTEQKIDSSGGSGGSSSNNKWESIIEFNERLTQDEAKEIPIKVNKNFKTLNEIYGFVQRTSSTPTGKSHYITNSGVVYSPISLISIGSSYIATSDDRFEFYVSIDSSLITETSFIIKLELVNLHSSTTSFIGSILIR